MKYFKNVMLALVAFVFVACGGPSESPAEVTKNFFEKYVDEKFLPEDLVKEDSFKYMRAKEIKDYRSNRYAPKIDSIKTAKYQEAINKDTAKVIITFTDGDKTSVDLVKENGKWVIFSFR